MTIHLDFVEFVTTIQQGSFSKAAEQLGVSKSHVSKQVTALEQRLGAQLIVRTTRKLSLTEIGEAYYRRCERILEDASEAESVISEIKREPQGVLNISLPNTFGERYIVPIIAAFMSQHSKLQANVAISTRNVDLQDEGFDLAVRIGEITEPRLVARKLGVISWIICATPNYLNQHDPPKTPDELDAHNCIVFDARGAHPQSFWTLSNSHATKQFPVKAVYTSNNADSLITCALEHVGLLYLPELFVREQLQSGQLTQVLKNWGLETQVSVVYPYSRHLSIKVRRFIDYLVEHLEL